MKKNFKGLKVVELANVLAGPAVGMFFAELGAEVIKIENKLTNGDVTRSWKLPTEDSSKNVSAYFASVNWGKKHLFVDFNIPSDYKKVIELIKKADIVISNYTPSTRKKFRLNYTDLKKINPSIIYGHISGFGENSERVAYDLILQAETGYMYMNGTPEVSPLKMPVALIDVLAAHQMKEAILIALINKIKTGKGSKITVSLFDSAIASLANQASNWLTAKHNPQPTGSLHPNIAPYGEIFTTKDKEQLVLAIGTDKQFIDLCSVLNSNNIADNILFNTNQKRVKNRKKLFNEIQLRVENISSIVLKKKLLQQNIPYGFIKSIKQLFEENKLNRLMLKDKKSNSELVRVKSII